MYKFILILLVTLSLKANDIVTYESQMSFEQTVENFKELVTQKGLIIFGIIDHHANAEKVNMNLSKAQVILFGNPKAGTVLMQENIVSGLDLPLKVLIYENKEGKTVISYHSAEWLEKTYGLKNDALIQKIDDSLKSISKVATAQK